MILLLYKAKKKKNGLLTSFHQTQQTHRQRAEISRLKSLKCVTATTARVRTNQPLQNTHTDTDHSQRERERERERERGKTSSTGHTSECFGRRKARIWEKEHNPMRRWVTAAGNEAERAQKMTREREGKTREGVRNSPPPSSLSLSLSLSSRSLVLASPCRIVCR